MATLNKILKRHWFPLGAFVLAFVFLAWLLQPRPRETYSFDLPEEYRLWNHFDPPSKIFSPSGRYVCCETSDEDGTSTIHLFDIHNKTWLFNDRCDYDKINSEPTFTANDELIYSAFHKPDKIKLACWKPGDAKPRIVHEYVYPIVLRYEGGPAGQATNDVPLPQPLDDAPFYGLCSFHSRDLFDRTLSPDGLTWLVIVKEGRLIYLDFIDSRTGKRNARVELPAIDLEKKAVVGIDVAFDPRSQYLLLRLRPELSEKEKDASNNWEVPTTLYWFDVASGKKSQSKTIRTELLPNGKLLSMDLKKVIFLSYSENLPVLQILNLEEGYKQIAMTDTFRDVLEETWPSGSIDSGRSLLRTSTFIHDSTDMESSLLMYTSSHFLSAKHGTIRGSPQLPGCSMGCRDLRTGRLLFTKAIELNRIYDDPNRRIGNGDVTALALPGPVFVLKYNNHEPEWINKPETWRYKIAEWIPALKHQRSTTFRICDPYSGKEQGELIVPQTNILTQVSTDLRSFSMLGSTGDDQYQCLVYDYPFHKPWLLIFSWAFGVAFTFFILQAWRRCAVKPT